MSEDAVDRPRRFRRERRANVDGGRQARHVVKVTPEEESALLAKAQHARVTVPRLLVESALADHSETASERREFAEQLFSGFRLLSAISINVNQMAKATNATGDLPDNLRVTLDEVRRVARRIDGILQEFDAR
ncbi:plasmid mobilization relaxosome protein MobC [Rhodococcus opacus]|uniref:Uncharacterized protein n=1 Tax=Rhodococcus opacus (strain B4) TaxID=632772 RepID=C1BE86_RHOOB|nr:plasmid mobilization relaxosome protein MobC [Rhodococcus opacus]BAH56126.1 hypothetical protein ROP_pKNR-00340 [Rhodococcus opacus B4]